MTDVSGIPNMGFGGGSYFGGQPNVAPAWSADQINRSMGMGPGGAGMQNQALLNNIFGNFGKQTDYYSGLGAAYGRATGGFGGAPGRVGTISNPGTANPGYNPGGFKMPAVPAGNVQRSPLPNIPTQSPLPQGQPFQPAVQSPARSPFTGLGFGGNRDFLAALMRNNASPTPPALHSQNPAAANSFLQAYQNMPPQSQINSRFGGMQPPEWSAEGITLGDKLRAQQPGIYSNSPFGN